MLNYLNKQLLYNLPVKNILINKNVRSASNASSSLFIIKEKKTKVGFIGKLVFIVILFLISHACQKQQADNLNNTTLDSLTQNALDSIQSNPFYSIDLYHKALLIADDSLLYYNISSGLITAYFHADQYDSCFLLANKLITFCRKQPNSIDIDSLLTYGNNYLGNYFMFMRNNDSAIHYFTKSIEYCNKLKNKEQKINLIINLADTYTQIGDYVNGIFLYKKALTITDSIKEHTKYHFPIYFGLGQTYLNMGDFEQSDIYYRLAEEDLNNRPLNERFIFCNNRGNYYFYKEEYRSALNWFQKAKQMLDPDKHVFYINLCNLNMGDVYNKLNLIDSAQYSLESPYQYFTAINHYPALFYLATVKAELAIKQNNIQEAHKWLEQYNDTTNIETLIITLRNNCLQKYYLANNDYKNAYYKLYQNKRTDDSIRSEKVKNRIAEFDMRYKHDTTILKQKELIYLQESSLKQLQLSRYLWASALFIVIIITVFVYLFIRKRNDLARLKHIDQITKLRMESIRNRISPHFLLNTLGSLAGNTEIPTSAQQKIKSLSVLLKKSLENIELIAIPLKSELEIVENYINLQKERIEGNFTFKITELTDKEQDFLIPSMLVQIPVENAIKHGLMPSENQDKTLNIDILNRGEYLNITITDNGIGINSANTFTKGTGLGLNSLYQTIHLLNTKNTNKITFQITDRSVENEKGTKVKIQVPNNFNYQL